MRLIDADALIEFCAERWIPLNIDAVNMQPTIQPEKAQLFQEGTTSDTISRQAALEKVRAMQTYKLFMGDDMILVDKTDVQTELMMLPPVQPEVLACGSGELVAQPELTDEQAITHLQSSGWMQRHDKEMYESGLKEYLADDSDSYDSLLPSAQPEPKKGHWIEWEQISAQRYFMSASYFYRCSACGVNNVRNTNYCPNCGAKMKGAEHETD